MPPSALVFDLDGTLVDSQRLIAEGVFRANLSGRGNSQQLNLGEAVGRDDTWGLTDDC